MKLKNKTNVNWTDRNGSTRNGEVISFIPAGTDVSSKMGKKILDLPVHRRKIESVTKFDRYLVSEQRENGTWIFARRPTELVIAV